ncbi:uncharacterized protein B0T23DRAFT_405326 [Neurospora hispaniola]|uniref:Secreted protein n=1 Tax=Neurospora hispaniola TaxID=588809 RepID=A0AAJ0MQI3_9PEZI|nr:hypothetical protein B0T23DRAFT_405326 [Neurospora hispaniola]
MPGPCFRQGSFFLLVRWFHGGRATPPSKRDIHLLFFLSSFGPAPPPPPLIAFHTDRSPPSPAFPNTART